MISLMKAHPFLKVINNSLIDLPSPSNISFWWNFGSLLGLCLGAQILTGLFLSMHYSGDTLIAFSSVSHISRDVNFGWGLRMAHANGASLFFVCLFLHLGRGIYYSSFNFFFTWMVGVLLLLMVMAAAFLGYVLPWGQMSFWGATVITNLFSAIPFIGTDVVNWMWGGFAVDSATLNRFYSLHFLVPFIVTGGVVVHLFFLHQSGSGNPLGVSSNFDKVPFHPYYSSKDLLGFCVTMFIYMMVVFFYPWALGDPENFIAANPLVTPIHIQPEWYFLFAYAILRSIPNKLGGVVALALSVMVFWTMGFLSKSKFKGLAFYPMLKVLFWVFCGVVILLTWIGARPVEDPYIVIGQTLTILYFLFFSLFSAMKKKSDHFFI